MRIDDDVKVSLCVVWRMGKYMFGFVYILCVYPTLTEDKKLNYLYVCF